MSTGYGVQNKGKDGKFHQLNVTSTYKGRTTENKTNTSHRHGLQSLGKVPTRRVPPPANLPSLKSESSGNNPNISLVPKNGTGWAAKDSSKSSSPSTTSQQQGSPAAQESQLQRPPQAAQRPASQHPNTNADTSSTKYPPEGPRQTWGDKNIRKPGFPPHEKRGHFSDDYPSLEDSAKNQVNSVQDKKDQLYGPGLSLRPQNVEAWRDGGGRNVSSMEKGPNSIPNKDEMMMGQPRQDNMMQQHPPANMHPGNYMDPHSQYRVPHPQYPPRYPNMPMNTQRGMPPPFDQMNRPDYPPHAMQRPDARYNMPMNDPNNQHSFKPVQHPMSDYEHDQGWAEMQGEVDYTEKLVFSDEEEADKNASASFERERERSKPADREPGDGHAPPPRQAWQPYPTDKHHYPPQQYHNYPPQPVNYGGPRFATGPNNYPNHMPAYDNGEQRHIDDREREKLMAVERAKKRKEDEERRMAGEKTDVHYEGGNERRPFHDMGEDRRKPMMDERGAPYPTSGAPPPHNIRNIPPRMRKQQDEGKWGPPGAPRQYHHDSRQYYPPPNQQNYQQMKPHSIMKREVVPETEPSPEPERVRQPSESSNRSYGDKTQKVDQQSTNRRTYSRSDSKSGKRGDVKDKPRLWEAPSDSRTSKPEKLKHQTSIESSASSVSTVDGKPQPRSHTTESAVKYRQEGRKVKMKSFRVDEDDVEVEKKEKKPAQAPNYANSSSAKPVKPEVASKQNDNKTPIDKASKPQPAEVKPKEKLPPKTKLYDARERHEDKKQDKPKPTSSGSTSANESKRTTDSRYDDSRGSYDKNSRRRITSSNKKSDKLPPQQKNFERRNNNQRKPPRKQDSTSAAPPRNVKDLPPRNDSRQQNKSPPTTESSKPSTPTATPKSPPVVPNTVPAAIPNTNFWEERKKEEERKKLQQQDSTVGTFTPTKNDKKRTLAETAPKKGVNEPAAGANVPTTATEKNVIKLPPRASSATKRQDSYDDPREKRPPRRVSLPDNGRGRGRSFQRYDARRGRGGRGRGEVPQAGRGAPQYTRGRGGRRRARPMQSAGRAHSNTYRSSRGDFHSNNNRRARSYSDYSDYTSTDGSYTSDYSDYSDTDEEYEKPPPKTTTTTAAAAKPAATTNGKTESKPANTKFPPRNFPEPRRGTGRRGNSNGRIDRGAKNFAPRGEPSRRGRGGRGQIYSAPRGRGRGSASQDFDRNFHSYKQNKFADHDGKPTVNGGFQKKKPNRPKNERPPRFQKLEQRQQHDTKPPPKDPVDGDGIMSSDVANEEWETASSNSAFSRDNNPEKNPKGGKGKPVNTANKNNKQNKAFSNQRPSSEKRSQKGPATGGQKNDRQVFTLHNVTYTNPDSVTDAIQNATNSEEAKKRRAKQHEETFRLYDLHNFASVVNVEDLPDVSHEKQLTEGDFVEEITPEDVKTPDDDDGFIPVLSKRQKKLIEQTRRKEDEKKIDISKKTTTEKIPHANVQQQQRLFNKTPGSPVSGASGAIKQAPHKKSNPKWTSSIGIGTWDPNEASVESKIVKSSNESELMAIATSSEKKDKVPSPHDSGVESSVPSSQRSSPGSDAKIAFSTFGGITTTSAAVTTSVEVLTSAHFETINTSQSQETSATITDSTTSSASEETKMTSASATTETKVQQPLLTLNPIGGERRVHSIENIHSMFDEAKQQNVISFVAPDTQDETSSNLFPSNPLPYTPFGERINEEKTSRSPFPGSFGSNAEAANNIFTSFKDRTPSPAQLSSTSDPPQADNLISAPYNILPPFHQMENVEPPSNFSHIIASSAAAHPHKEENSEINIGSSAQESNPEPQVILPEDKMPEVTATSSVKENSKILTVTSPSMDFNMKMESAKRAWDTASSHQQISLSNMEAFSSFRKTLNGSTENSISATQTTYTTVVDTLQWQKNTITTATASEGNSNNSAVLPTALNPPNTTIATDVVTSSFQMPSAPTSMVVSSIVTTMATQSTTTFPTSQRPPSSYQPISSTSLHNNLQQMQHQALYGPSFQTTQDHHPYVGAQPYGGMQLQTREYMLQGSNMVPSSVKPSGMNSMSLRPPSSNMNFAGADIAPHHPITHRGALSPTAPAPQLYVPVLDNSLQRSQSTSFYSHHNTSTQQPHVSTGWQHMQPSLDAQMSSQIIPPGSMLMQPAVLSKTSDHDSLRGSYRPPFRTDDYSANTMVNASFAQKQPLQTTSQPSNILNYDNSLMKAGVKPMQGSAFNMDYKTSQSFLTDKTSPVTGMIPNAMKFPPFSAPANSRMNSNKIFHQTMPMPMVSDLKQNNLIGVIQPNPVQGILSRPFSRDGPSSTSYVPKNQVNQVFTPWNASNIPKPPTAGMMPPHPMDMMQKNTVRLTQPRMPVHPPYQPRQMTVPPSMPMMPNGQHYVPRHFDPSMQPPSSEITNWKPVAPPPTAAPVKPPPVPSLVMGNVPKSLTAAGKKTQFLPTEELQANKAKDRESLLSSLSSFFPAHKTEKNNFPPTTRVFSSRPGRKKNYISPSSPTPFPSSAPMAGSDLAKQRSGPIGVTKTTTEVMPAIAIESQADETEMTAINSMEEKVVVAKITKTMTLAETRPKKGEVKKIELD